MRYAKLVAVAGCVLIANGCTKPQDSVSSGRSSDVITMDSLPPSMEGVESHPSEGPHHGSLVELGNEEYHAEIVHDADSVSVYILDGAATEAVPIESPELTINLIHDGTPEQFKLTAAPEDGEPEGKSSRFMLKDADLVAHLDDEAAAPKLVVTINGAPYRADIAHDHDHEGHDHSH